MPSPLAHGSMVLLARAWAARSEELDLALCKHPRFFVAATIGLLCAPDLDFALRLLIDHPLLAHGGATHSLVAGVGFALVFVGTCRWIIGKSLSLAPMLAVGLCCSWSHSLMDSATWGGKGIMILWPFTTDRFLTLPVFFGVHHSEPTAWKLHLVTIVSEFLFVALVWGASKFLAGRKSVAQTFPSSGQNDQTTEGSENG